jgi:hypothetical protein
MACSGQCAGSLLIRHCVSVELLVCAYVMLLHMVVFDVSYCVGFQGWKRRGVCVRGALWGVRVAYCSVAIGRLMVGSRVVCGCATHTCAFSGCVCAGHVNLASNAGLHFEAALVPVHVVF